ncbi:hypothetical protein Poly41_40130 [Novipirellula artificiosorum]|uniref:Secreted protein n=1 Tax=Novipirellula artificiosorum TaxID=2528016 RepID=A0A5C6DDJ5_9BACT|nr:hypothetical protein Poly41_40130 [Novipirellula artificiosorum]
MFRLLFVSFIALRVIACPVCCAGGDAQVASVEAAVTDCDCCCSKSQSNPCGDGEPSPPESPCPCESGCECQVAPEMNHRLIVDVQWMMDVTPLCLDTVGLPEAFVDRFEEQPHRLDLLTGRSVRLAHASLLL